MQLALLMLFPFVISLVLMLGYNKLAATAVTAGSVAIGLMGTTFAYSTTQMLQQYLSVKTTTQIWTKIILLVLGLVILLANVLKFGKKESTTSTKEARQQYLQSLTGTTTTGTTTTGTTTTGTTSTTK